MAAGAIRGSRIGAGPMGESERGHTAPRRAVTYFCENHHETLLHFAAAAETPESWDCVRCGAPAGVNSEDVPTTQATEPYKTHLAYVKERRTESEAKTILSDALSELRFKRKTGEIIF